MAVRAILLGLVAYAHEEGIVVPNLNRTPLPNPMPTVDPFREGQWVTYQNMDRQICWVCPTTKEWVQLYEFDGSLGSDKVETSNIAHVGEPVFAVGQWAQYITGPTGDFQVGSVSASSVRFFEADGSLQPQQVLRNKLRHVSDATFKAGDYALGKKSVDGDDTRVCSVSGKRANLCLGVSVAMSDLRHSTRLPKLASIATATTAAAGRTAVTTMPIAGATTMPIAGATTMPIAGATTVPAITATTNATYTTTSMLASEESSSSVGLIISLMLIFVVVCLLCVGGYFVYRSGNSRDANGSTKVQNTTNVALAQESCPLATRRLLGKSAESLAERRENGKGHGAAGKSRRQQQRGAYRSTAVMKKQTKV